MPLWHLYCPENVYSAEDKRALAARITDLYAQVGLPEPRITSYRLEGEMEALIGRSFPHPGDDEKIREIFHAALKDDALDIQPRLQDGQIRYGFPVSVLVAER